MLVLFSFPQDSGAYSILISFISFWLVGFLCYIVYTALCLHLRKKISSEKTRLFFLSLEHQSNQVRGNEVEMECDIWGKAFL